jgi:uncharacterized protein DUF1161
MKCQLAVAALLLSCAYATAQEPARKSCEDLKAEINKKLDAKKVIGYTLDIVDKGKDGEGKVIGECDGGTKSIVYTRGAAPENKAADAKPQAGH